MNNRIILSIVLIISSAIALHLTAMQPETVDIVTDAPPVTMKDGKKLVYGIAHEGWKKLVALARFNSDGSFDRSFGKNGVATANIGALSVVTGVIEESDGTILVNAVYYDSKTQVYHVTKARFDKNAQKEPINLREPTKLQK